MFGLGPLEILLIVVLLFLVFKAKKIPEIIRSVGKGVIEFKKAANDEPTELDAEFDSKSKVRKKEN